MDYVNQPGSGKISHGAAVDISFLQLTFYKTGNIAQYPVYKTALAVTLHLHHHILPAVFPAHDVEQHRATA